MPDTVQDFFAAATHKASEELTAAFLRLPEDKRAWSPGGEARTAVDMVAECAVLSGYTATLLQTRTWQSGTFQNFSQEKSALASGDWEPLHAALAESTARVVAAIQSVPNDALAIELQLPASKMTLAQGVARAYWNMTYHEGQINYIAALLGL